MQSSFKQIALATALSAACSAASAATGIKITEWMYNGDEFVEVTNFGPTPIDLTGWSYDDSSRAPGSFSLSSIGAVNPGQVFIIAEALAADFRAAWSLPANVKIAGGNSHNLGRSDEINIYDGSSTLVDRLTYNDQVAGPRTLNVSGRPLTLAALGANDAAQWALSAIGDGAGSYTSSAGFIGNPGIAPIPEPETYALMLAGLGLVGLLARRRANSRP